MIPTKVVNDLRVKIGEGLERAEVWPSKLLHPSSIQRTVRGHLKPLPELNLGEEIQVLELNYLLHRFHILVHRLLFNYILLELLGVAAAAVRVGLLLTEWRVLASLVAVGFHPYAAIGLRRPA